MEALHHIYSKCETDPSKTNKNIRNFKLPFIGKLSEFSENESQKLTKKFCKEGTNVKIVFSSFKLASPFSTKGKISIFFMGYNEQKWLESDHGRLIKFYCKYVDDIFCLFKNEHQALTFIYFLNIQHPNLNFTIE